MVRQFADRYAFLRELVQNGIDAGATRIEVRIDRDADGAVITSVDDDGSGMTREIIEGPLLTLFSSSKEDDSSKIGKYGIGFVSVFAMEPVHVDVHTRRGDAEQWRVRLFGDHSFELSRMPRDTNGTTVSIVQPKEEGDFDAHVERAQVALTKWCRHARVPITLMILDAANLTASRSVTINEPFGLGGAVTAAHAADNETFFVAVGRDSERSEPSASSALHAGYYNRGLTLFESNDAERGLGGVRFKVDSPRLSHTLSRDNVKRDREHDRVLGVVKELVRERLWREVVVRVSDAAEKVGASPRDEGAIRDCRLLLEATFATAFEKEKNEGVRVPLIEPLDGKRTLLLNDLEPGPSGAYLVGDESTPLTRALASQNVAVVHSAAQMAVLRRSKSSRVLEPSHALGHVVRIAEAQRHDVDDALTAGIVSVLKRAGLAVASAFVATFDGASKTDFFRVVDGRGEEAITVPIADLEARGRPWGRSATLFLNVEDAAVRLGRRRAKIDPIGAAHLVARRILIEDSGPLPAKVVDRLLEEAVKALSNG